VTPTANNDCRRLPSRLAPGLVLWIAICGGSACSAGNPQSPVAVHQYSYTVVKSHPHSPEDFTQGLVYADDRVYESTGLYGRSAISIKSLESGMVIKEMRLPERYFGEGLTVMDDRLVQLTYLEQTGFIYDRSSLKVLQEFRYRGEGWGLTYDGRHLIMSNGTSRLKFLDPANYREQRSLKVSRMGVEERNLNELEYIEGRIYANVWLRALILEIDPVTGHVTGEIDLSALAAKHAVMPEAVLNGIAYNSRNRTLLVTGKLWPVLYEIKLHSRN
jgi:glutaminyl-peptide cyclotransferase